MLDAGCGGGRVALALQERGHDVVGIDTSPGAVAVSAARGVVDVHRRSIASMRTADGPFDAVALFGNGFGLLRDARHAVWLLRRLAAVAPSGVILGTARDPYRTEDPAQLAYHTRNRAAGRMSGQSRFRLRFRDERTPWFDFLFLSLDELETLAGEAGWTVRTAHEDPDGRYAAVLGRAG